jgi:hypothetical protein
MLLSGLEKIVGMLEFLSKLLAAEEMTIGRVLLPLAAMARVTFWSFWVAFARSMNLLNCSSTCGCPTAMVV